MHSSRYHLHSFWDALLEPIHWMRCDLSAPSIIFAYMSCKWLHRHQKDCVGVEPFWKIPMAEVGFGKIRLQTSGIFISAKYRLSRAGFWETLGAGTRRSGRVLRNPTHRVLRVSQNPNNSVKGFSKPEQNLRHRVLRVSQNPTQTPNQG